MLIWCWCQIFCPKLKNRKHVELNLIPTFPTAALLIKVFISTRSFYSITFITSYTSEIERMHAQLRKLDLPVIPTVAKNYWRTITVYEMTLKLLNKAACFFPCCFFWVLEYIHGFVAMTVSRLKSFLKIRQSVTFTLIQLGNR